MRDKAVQSPPTSRLSSTAFYSTLNKTKSRRQKQIYPSPPLGTYDPTPSYLLTAHQKPFAKISKTDRFANSHRQTQSTDYLDYERVYRMMEKRVSGFSMQRQLARERAEYDYEKERAELYRPALQLPEHLRKFKGLFHVSDFAPEDSNNIQRGADDINSRMKTIKATISGLKDFGKEITRHMFKSKRED
eukprot:CAMPEP_0204910320 /NCGR_PEP_ID=MMETSP1397-20131031/8869_1 /ASSEMBLY_ACC=CAM_ASM_000891 /TAXON_ID=49980 /ORGANISM="Climacostomum Climacostomum virens, Strain Stock W-24" /LENGTH=188 /DNA_ID=CAMNT_0052080443 /DNA_START=174 /DNA_END=740 /DNA_ORIENTATION=+